MKETSDRVAEIAAKGMTLPLTRAEQKSVCASCLGQREHALSMVKIRQRIKRIKRLAVVGAAPKLLAELDALLRLLTNDATAAP